MGKIIELKMGDINMNKKGHTIGITAISITSIVIMYNMKSYTHIDPLESMLLIPSIMLGGYMPDIDADYSYFRSQFTLLARIYDIFPKKNFLFKHRGLVMHSFYTLITPLILAFFVNKIPVLPVIGLSLGLLSHHVLDILTPQGLPNYFWPIKVFK